MRVRNATSAAITLTDIKVPAFGTGVARIGAGETVQVWNEDALRSKQLQALLLSGAMTETDETEPNVLTDFNESLLDAVEQLRADVNALQAGT